MNDIQACKSCVPRNINLLTERCKFKNPFVNICRRIQLKKDSADRPWGLQHCWKFCQSESEWNLMIWCCPIPNISTGHSSRLKVSKASTARYQIFSKELRRDMHFRFNGKPFFPYFTFVWQHFRGLNRFQGGLKCQRLYIWEPEGRGWKTEGKDQNWGATIFILNHLYGWNLLWSLYVGPATYLADCSDKRVAGNAIVQFVPWWHDTKIENNIWYDKKQRQWHVFLYSNKRRNVFGILCFETIFVRQNVSFSLRLSWQLLERLWFRPVGCLKAVRLFPQWDFLVSPGELESFSKNL